MQHLAAFLILSILVILAPGPDTAVVTKNVLQHGRTAAIRTSMGVSAGLLCWTTASAAGVAALLRASAHVFDVLRLAGAAYLVFLGIQAIVGTIHRRGTAPPGTPADDEHATASTAAQSEDADAGPPVRGGRAFRQGLMSNLLNPKIGVFFTSFLPQFVAPGSAVLPVTALLGAAFAAMALAWLIVFTALATRLATVLRRSAVRRWIERTTGAVLIGFGVRLATERR